jgi:hypothetical protein
MSPPSKTRGTLLVLPVILIVVAPAKFAARTPGDENIAVNLHHFFFRQSRTRVQVVHVLSNEQKFVCVLGQCRDCRVRCIGLCVPDALPAFAVPFPNKFRISLECFRCC